MTDYILQAAVDLLIDLRDGKARLHDVVDVSMGDMDEKQRVRDFAAGQLVAVEELLAENRREFNGVFAARVTAAERRKAWRRIVSRRLQALQLIERVRPRSPLQPAIDQLQEVSRRWTLSRCGANTKGREERTTASTAGIDAVGRGKPLDAPPASLPGNPSPAPV